MLHPSYNQDRHACGGTVIADKHDGSAYIGCSRCGAFSYVEEGGDSLPRGCDPVRNQQAWDDGEPRSPDEQLDDVPVGHVPCESGEWCSDIEPHTCLVQVAEVVRYVPDYLRDTATAAGSWRGVAERITVCPSCAEHMVEHDPEWVRWV